MKMLMWGMSKNQLENELKAVISNEIQVNESVTSQALRVRSKNKTQSNKTIFS